MTRQSSADSERDARSVLDGKRRGRIVAGGLGLLLGLWFSWYTWSTVPFGTQDRPGAGVFPLVVGIGMVVVSVMTIVEALRTDQVSGEIRFPTGEKRRTVLLMAVAMVAFVALYQFLGQYIASSLFMITALAALGTRSWVRNVVYGTAIGVAISAFFMELLGVRLPEGLLGPTGVIGGLFL
ncbi:tripartite tricarboxylate transporter TctB family protein [Geodermatophilus sp. DSM 45219]|uniref:tripartite tricarboxylate transporter TctB family protein n=1 Tax=Geodermatophilus sp. DSM 45219 TaxID=1881103 RepID=UPI00087EDFCE|nr:tripartite tricarboxylate transporter TctB family protein [Geodermatophilus sp. DSM 45219]SDN56381.1 Tripartite tricarboxylate transporter TctB family protein [Geodermatophilus sp. DSM 45219]